MFFVVACALCAAGVQTELGRNITLHKQFRRWAQRTLDSLTSLPPRAGRLAGRMPPPPPNYRGMNESLSSHLNRLAALVLGTLRPPPGVARITLALVYGALCHTLFGLAVLAMIVAMFFGMSESFGRLFTPWSILTNIALVLQSPVVHSLLLAPRGNIFLTKLAPQGHGKTLATTTYAIIASIQLLALFTLWTPSGTIWWSAQGGVFGLICALYTLSWLLLIWASFDAGAEVQSGALGWMLSLIHI